MKAFLSSPQMASIPSLSIQKITPFLGNLKVVSPTVKPFYEFSIEVGQA
jgi:hypothetical protein